MVTLTELVPTTRLSFYHWRNNRSLARRDKRLALKIHHLKEKIYYFQRELKKDELKGLVRKVHDDAAELEKDLQKEIENIFKIEKHGQMQEYDLIKKVNEVQKELEGAIAALKKKAKKGEVPQETVRKHVLALSKVDRDVKDLQSKAHENIRRAHMHFDRISKDRHMMLEFTNFMGLDFLIRKIRHDEYATYVRVGELDKEYDKITKDVKKELKDTKHLEEDKLDVADYAEKFVRDANAEVDDLYSIELNSAVFLLYMKEMITWLREFFLKIKKEGYPMKTVKDNVSKLTEVSNELESHIEKDKSDFNWLRRYAGGGLLFK